MDSVDTIFALSSGAPPAAIAVVRISGTQAFEAVRALAGKVPAARKASLRTLRDADGSTLDEALVLTFPGPATATGEDLAELHLHGGRAVVRGVEAALAAMPGLRKAEPGEFTRRAFQHGRIDLNEAEGLADLLSAETEWQRRSALAMAGGGFSRQIEDWRMAILVLSAQVEAVLDFSDEGDVSETENTNISKRCLELHDVMTRQLSAPSAEKLRDGLRVVLAGPPNSGKSTLLNALVSREAAIVSDIAGTTRDLIEVPVSFSGMPFLLTDTAGLRDDSQDAIESIGIDRANAAIANADMLLWLGTEGEGPEHSLTLEIEAKVDDPSHCIKSSNSLRLSARTGEGVVALIDWLVETGRTMLPPPDSFAINQRQQGLLKQCALSLSAAAKSTDLLVSAEELRQARLALDALTGRASTEDMLDALFGRFCIGK
ncbi:tRNA uridine-5-carboxymethylaminomethyl(34) synthesis GTPase MnmE [Sphingorhabdus sp.]|jgi:tRNA modification GTPase|uniref:tRNA uridine-5-carboxymethylaminomethyl(34) synthesis GTPase MnmE n=1 Tax=Sphingorhabdus sp. TaxID=1902408 RepID=UPI003BAF1661|nr:tRNA uridine-5-carboxymethylaminomethyl(34) synthesis GTPase MnmE [Sphingomonadales bacterium]MBL0023335.1 tRNA uridine-5-carboxymethylaminomethyl(34) synthesis GTPase MnmE [Sphingomonadales bacterium]